MTSESGREGAGVEPPAPYSTKTYVPATRLVCAGCGASIPATEIFPFRCPRAGHDDGEHVVKRVLDPSSVRFVADAHPNPFARFRTLLHAYHVARSRRERDDAFVGRVERLDAAVAAVDGRGFRVTPYARHAALSDLLGFAPDSGVWVKDETGNVSGSHKARHLMGLALYLDIVDVPVARRLAIASCGNAALAAAVIARAAGRPLEVFVPEDAEPGVLRRLTELGAKQVVCARDGTTQGDPCLAGLHAALARGALPFTVQGSENGLAIDGGATLGDEIVESMRADGRVLDHVFVQTGGGALASAVMQAFDDALALGALPKAPRIHTVQTLGTHPLRRAYERVRARIVRRLGPADATERDHARAAGREAGARAVVEMSPASIAADRRTADRMRERNAQGIVSEELHYAATHRSEFMWPWESVPVSIAHGILDDETYDWLAAVRGMIRTGGWPLLVPERALRKAYHHARTTTIARPSHTGSAGLAALMELVSLGGVDPHERVAVLMTGAER